MQRDSLRERLKEYAEISEIEEISRRYLVMNAFDGTLTMLGVIIGAYLAKIKSPLSIISAGLAGSMAMGISGIAGAYMTERAERLRRLKELERAMLKNLRKSVHYRSQRFATLVVALIDGLSPMIASICVLFPFFLVHFSIIPFSIAIYLSIAMALLIMTLLGIYLAKISKESKLKYGLQMIGIGILTALACILISMALGGGVT